MSEHTFSGKETRRLQELVKYRFLRSGNNASFDHIVRLASKIFNVPTSLLSFVETDIQWFAAQTGFEPCETSRDVSFCAHALEGSDVLVVPDALEDPRFASNALVTGAPFIRFYAGAPLITSNGNVLGSPASVSLIKNHGRIFRQRIRKRCGDWRNWPWTRWK